MGYSTTQIDIDEALKLAQNGKIVSASSIILLYNHENWQSHVAKAEIKDNNKTIFFTLKTSDFVEVDL